VLGAIQLRISIQDAHGLFTFSFPNRKVRCESSAVTMAQAFVYLHYAMYCYAVSNHTLLETGNDS